MSVNLVPAGFGYNVGTIQLALTVIAVAADFFVLLWKLLPIIIDLDREDAKSLGKELRKWVPKKQDRSQTTEGGSPGSRPSSGVVTVWEGGHRRDLSREDAERSSTGRSRG